MQKECQSTEAIMIECIELYGDTTEKEKLKKESIKYALNLLLCTLLF